MDLLEKIALCNSEEEVDNVVSVAIKEADENSNKVGQLGFINGNNASPTFKGFIPLKTRIRYSNLAMEDYGMETTDFIYSFAHFVKKYNIQNKGSVVSFLEWFINDYFGLGGNKTREQIFNDYAWNNSETDEEYFQMLENNKLGDLKGSGASMCTERSALAEQILTLFGIESYYCMGCVERKGKQEAHCFNVTKGKDGYILIDYSIPVPKYNEEGKIERYYPFLGKMTNEEFEEFKTTGCVKDFDDYIQIDGKDKPEVIGKRSYVIGKYEIVKNYTEDLTK